MARGREMSCHNVHHNIRVADPMLMRCLESFANVGLWWKQYCTDSFYRYHKEANVFGDLIFATYEASVKSCALSSILNVWQIPSSDHTGLNSSEQLATRFPSQRQSAMENSTWGTSCKTSSLHLTTFLRRCSSMNDASRNSQRAWRRHPCTTPDCALPSLLSGVFPHR